MERWDNVATNGKRVWQWLPGGNECLAAASSGRETHVPSTTQQILYQISVDLT